MKQNYLESPLSYKLLSYHLTQHLPSMLPIQKPLPSAKQATADVANLSGDSNTSEGLKLLVLKASSKFQTCIILY